MPRPRTPLAKAKATGRTAHDPKRYKDRKDPNSKPLGRPSRHLTAIARECWEAFKVELPWLTEGDRALVESASRLRAVLWTADVTEDDDGETIEPLSLDAIIKTANALRLCLTQMGATPADRTKIAAPPTDGEEKDPAAEFIN
jgi:hypothetical protein